jgi:hypothetical protein
MVGLGIVTSAIVVGPKNVEQVLSFVSIELYTARFDRLFEIAEWRVPFYGARPVLVECIIGDGAPVLRLLHPMLSSAWVGNRVRVLHAPND